MLRTKRLDDEGVAKLCATTNRISVRDPELPGHYIRITPNGSKSFWAVARDKSGKQVWKMIGACDSMSIDDARTKAMAFIRIIRGTTVIDKTDKEDTTTFEAIASQWLVRHVEKNNLRSDRMIRSLLKNHILPSFAGMKFEEVRRSHITALLDRVEDNSGARTADYVLSIISGICLWYASRHDDYTSPIIRGMRRVKAGGRERILSDDEIGTLWTADGSFGALTKFALLTAQRKEKLLTMRFDDVRDGVWNIPKEKREKGNGELLRLPPMALDIIEERARACSGSDLVFAGDVGLAWAKLKFDKAHPMPHWTIHDLRRTARSLMAAAGVPEKHAERILGHVQQGVVGIYDRHAYLDEKADALLRLSNRIRDIVTPPPSNVEKLRKRA